MKQVTLYTDGACSGNPGKGGWGVFLQYGDVKKTLSGSAEHTTNNQMELMAVIEGLNALKSPCDVTLYTDSTYVLHGITKWLEGWKRKGWKTAGNKPVKNQELWQALDKAAARHQIDWQWVKGHSGNAGNDMADQLATSAIERI